VRGQKLNPSVVSPDLVVSLLVDYGKQYVKYTRMHHSQGQIW